jgi:hypothetical protein
MDDENAANPHGDVDLDREGQTEPRLQKSPIQEKVKKDRWMSGE